MALVARLEDVRPTEILYYLAMAQKTGKLDLTTGVEEGVIVFRSGKIIYAASSSIRETFGSIALGFQLLNRVQLTEALHRQHRSHSDVRLGEVLVQMGVMTATDLERVLVHQVTHVLREIFGWCTGYFRFRNLEIERFGDVEVDARELIAESPLDPEMVALEATRLSDEATPSDELETSAVVADLEKLDEEDSGVFERTSMVQIMNDLPAPALTAEMVREIFDVSSPALSRGALFAVHSHGVRGLAQYGLADGQISPSQRIRKLWLPTTEQSLFTQVVNGAAPYRGPLEENRWNRVLVTSLAGDWPDEVVAIPMVLEGRVSLVFYGDNSPAGDPIGSTDELQETLRTVEHRLSAVFF